MSGAPQPPATAAAASEGESNAMEVAFPSGLPGFPDARRFAFAPLPGLEPFGKLRCLDREQLEFVVVPPAPLFPDYVVRVEEEDAARLGLERSEDALVLLIVTVPQAPAQASANLLGPVVINPAARLAAQVVQHGSDYDVRAALPVSVS
ncbi:MAG: flagellar assembly protein FliW [Acidimicrobiales bacterium]